MKAIIAASLTLAVTILPAEAAIPAPVMKVMGAQFYSKCTTPPPGHETAVIVACEAYVSGIADGLQAEGRICVGPRMTSDRLLPVALVWIRGHSYNGGYPASSQILTGLENAFPCRQVGRPQPQPQVTADQRMEQFEKWVQFGASVKTALGLLGLMG